MTALILVATTALISMLATPRAFASLRTAFPEIPLAWLERRLVI